MPEAINGLAAAIRAARRAKGLTQADVAAQLGITKHAVSMWETRRNVPDHRRFAALVRLLELDVAEVLELAPPPPRAGCPTCRAIYDLLTVGHARPLTSIDRKVMMDI
ncbi:MAG TPA: helix-turn-helix transcriptional regulator [Reyranella sp.]|jgi:transcriptional regulator with XRE-family HTH domain|nr:helix-turn-helix transcriptional regulator [Reyranella sp.]